MHIIIRPIFHGRVRLANYLYNPATRQRVAGIKILSFDFEVSLLRYWQLGNGCYALKDCRYQKIRNQSWWKFSTFMSVQIFSRVCGFSFSSKKRKFRQRERCSYFSTGQCTDLYYCGLHFIVFIQTCRYLVRMMKMRNQSCWKLSTFMTVQIFSCVYRYHFLHNANLTGRGVQISLR